MRLLIYYIVFNSLSDWKIYCGETDSDNCTNLRDELALASSNFTACGVYYSRPIKLCEMCVDPYIEIIQTYTKMNELSVNDSKCIDYFVDQDRLEILKTLYGGAVSLWERAKCYECFQFENKQLTNNLSAETVQFLQYYNKTLDCLNTTGVNNNITTVCEKCMNDYLTLDQYYQSISDENEKIGVCMDIVDLMNNTRKFWSKNCCRLRKHDETIFIISAVGVLLLTVIFYAIAQWCTEKKTPTIVQQPRFVESLNNLST